MEFRVGVDCDIGGSELKAIEVVLKYFSTEENAGRRLPGFIRKYEFC